MIELDGHQLTIPQVWAIAGSGAPCRVADGARERMQESRRLVDQLAGESRAIYGINTGFGPLSGTRVSGADLAQHQLNLLHHLSVGQGPLFSPLEVRAIMAARANALARGYSGIRPEVVDLLLELLNRDLLPEIPSEGSVGASGDLVPLAHMGRVLVGLGHVRQGSRRMTAEAALKSAGLTAVVLQCKEGLALVNGTSVMTGLAATAVQEAGQLLSWAEFLTACLFQALWAAPEVLCEQAHRARGFRGQAACAERIAGYLLSHPDFCRQIQEHQWGSHAKPVEPGVEVQDPYSVRCTPQIFGAFQESLWHVDYMVTRELNASTDNPLVFPETGSVIHCGNFYGQQVSMACDYLRIGLAKVALLVERQMDRLLNWRYSMGLPPLLAGGEPGLNSGLAGCQLLATSLAAECRMLAAPASVQTIPTNANNQDVVSMGCIAAKQTREQLNKVWSIVSLQALALAQAADLRGNDVMGEGYGMFHRLLREQSPELGPDRPLYEEIQRVTDWLRSDRAQEALLVRRPESPWEI